MRMALDQQAAELVAFDDGVFRLTDKGRQQNGEPS